MSDAVRMRGNMGRAMLMTVPGTTPAHQAHLCGWLIESRETGLPWWQFQLSVIHLRQIEGVRPPVLRSPEATHEVMVVAYDPDRPVTADGRKTGVWLQPINLSAQFTSTDFHAIELAGHLSEKAIDGELHLEPMPSAATIAMCLTGQVPMIHDTRWQWHEAISEFTGGKVW